MFSKLAIFQILIAVKIFADITVNQDLKIAVGPINELEINDKDVALTLSSRDLQIKEGFLESDLYNVSSCSYTILSDKPKKITAILSKPLPDNVKLYVKISSDDRKNSEFVPLTASTKTPIIQGLPNIARENSLSISYKIRAQNHAKPVTNLPTSIIYTLEDDL